ncbi:MAG: DUF805 domain-containing protein [Pseudomonadota bacterium]
MDWLRALFSFRGRTSRLSYWRVGLGVSVVLSALWVLSIVLAMNASPAAAIPLLLAAPLLLVLAAVCVRRLHDRGKGAGWLLLFWGGPMGLYLAVESMIEADGTGGLAAAAMALAGLGIEIWAIVELGFLRGSPGVNRFGPPPPVRLRLRAMKAA